MEASSKKPFVSALASLKRPCANCFYLDLTAVRTDLISSSLQNLETCFICLEDEFNLRKTLCCGQTAHMRCIRNWIRTLIPSSVRCPGCWMDYAFPLSPKDTQTLDVLTVNNVYRLHILKFTHLWHKGLLPVLFQNYFQYPRSIHGYNTRYASKQNLYKPKERTNIGKQTVAFSASVLWDDIPVDLKNLNAF